MLIRKVRRQRNGGKTKDAGVDEEEATAKAVEGVEGSISVSEGGEDTSVTDSITTYSEVFEWKTTEGDDVYKGRKKTKNPMKRQQRWLDNSLIILSPALEFCKSYTGTGA